MSAHTFVRQAPDAPLGLHTNFIRNATVHFYSVCAACRRRRGRGRGDRDGDEREPRGEDGKEKKEFEERVVQVSRVTKVVKGGKQMSFRAVVVVGDEKGKARARPSKSRRTAEGRDGGGACSGCCHTL